MLEGMGQPVRRELLERIGIYYDFGKKNVLHLPILQKELKEIKERCGECGEKLYAQKTKERKVLTLNGERILKTRFKYCKKHGASNQALISIINRICPPGYAFDSKVMIVVGILRWFFNLQRSS
jgi:hypothetical protein